MVRSSLLNELSGLKTIMVGGSIKNLFSIHVSFFGCFSRKQDTKIIYKKLLHKNDLEKGFEEWIIVQWGRTCRRPYGLITQSLTSWNVVLESSFPKVLSNTAARKIIEDVREEKACSGVQKLKDHWPFAWRLKKWHSTTDFPRKHQELKENLFMEHHWGTSARVLAFYAIWLRNMMIHFEVPEVFLL